MELKELAIAREKMRSDLKKRRGWGKNAKGCQKVCNLAPQKKWMMMMMKKKKKKKKSRRKKKKSYYNCCLLYTSPSPRD